MGLSATTPFIWGKGGIRTHDGTYIHQINSLDFSASKATNPFADDLGFEPRIGISPRLINSQVP